MKLLTNRVRGMQDLLPENSKKWEVLEQVMKDEAQKYGFKSVRTPILEHTELFEHSSGDTSDIVQKEMYTFLDKGNRSVTLRPEGTPGVLRLFLENGLQNSALPLKLMYFSSFYRYDKPQAGRWREFFQFGAEVFGTASPLADAELILLASSIFERLGIKNVNLEINTLGCKQCRKNHNAALKNFFKSQKANLCNTCLTRLEKNPMRILDCKSEICKNICKKAPLLIDFVCNECKEHFEDVQKYLNGANLKFTLNPKIVRGLDYYTKTVFEFTYNGLALGGGGRYDELSNIIGNVEMPALGFGLGVERILSVMEKQNISFLEEKPVKIYIACMDKESKILAITLSENLRKSSIKTEINITERNFKAQIKYADKIGVKYFLAIGEEELKNGTGKLKNMKDGNETEINLGENFMKEFLDKTID